MKRKLAIGIAYHKDMDFAKYDPYIPIQVGAAYHDDLEIQKDSDGENISSDNPYVSEMSATYWLWKNVDAEYKGLFHYRRFLTYEKGNVLSVLVNMGIFAASKALSPFVKDTRYMCSFSPSINIDSDRTEEHLRRFAKDIDADINKGEISLFCLKRNRYSTYTMQTHLRKAIGFWHYNYIVEMMAKEQPAFNAYFEKTLKSNSFVPCNMLVAKTEIFDEYCVIMFDIMHKYLRHMNDAIPKGVVNVAMLRDFGYIAELITDAYVRMITDKGAKVRYLNCMSVNMNVAGMSSVQTSLWQRIKNNL